MQREKSQSFAGSVRDELVRLPMGKSCCQLSEIGALTRTSGHLRFRSGGVLTVSYRIENTGAARRLFQLLRRVWASARFCTIRCRRSWAGGGPGC